MKQIIGRLLVVFAVFTLGYGLGRDAGLQRAMANNGASSADAGGGNRVIVYYLHTTFRCPTCNAIERHAKELVHQDYAEQLARGVIEWHTINFQEHEDLAQRYKLAAGAVVVAKIEHGKEVAFQRLDDVWTLYDKPEQFKRYVEDAINMYLKELNL